jgi:hypothetical protein
MSVSLKRIFLSLLLGASILLNMSRAGPLLMYSCPDSSSATQAHVCPIGCRDMSSSAGYFEFKVDSISRSVMKISKLSSPIEVNGKTLPRGHTFNSEVFEKCKIFDKKNWDCSTSEKPIDEPQMGIYSAQGEFRRMVNGIYQNQIWMEVSQGQYSKRKKTIISAYCMAPLSN